MRVCRSKSCAASKEFSEAGYYLWRNKFGGMDVLDAKRLKALEAENARLKKLLAESMLENEVTREALRKKCRRTGSTRSGAHDEATRIVRTTCAESRRNEREFVALPATSDAHRSCAWLSHRRYGAGMIYLKLRQAGHRVNHKRVDRLYALEKLQVRRRRRKKIQISERQPLERPSSANAVGSMDFVFDRVAGGRTIKSLAVVDDATHEAVAVVPEHSISGHQLVRILEKKLRATRLPQVCSHRQRQGILQSRDIDLGPESQVVLRLIEPGKPNQNAYIESFNGQLRDECLSERWFTQPCARKGSDRSLAA